MKIIIVGTSHPFRGGLASFNDRLAKEFVRQGDEVQMVTFTLQYPAFLFPGKTQYTDDPPDSELHILQKINSINPLSWIKVGREIRNQKPDMVVFCYWMAFFAPCFGTIARQLNKKTTKRIGLIHNMIPHEPTLLDKLLPPYFIKAMDAFVAMTDSVVDDIKRFDKKDAPKKISPHPIYDLYGKQVERTQALQHLHLEPNYRYILFFGFIRKYKGLDLLLKAFADVRLRQYPIKLIVAGEFYDSEEPYREIIRKNALEDLVVLRNDFIPNEEIKYYFSVADLVAQTYRTATQSGVSQIAYNFEVPLLVTNVGGLSQTIPHGKVGYVVDAKKDEIANALLDFFENDRRQEFIENVKIEKQKYEWSRMTDTIKQLQ